MKRLLRVLQILTYPFLILSFGLLSGMGFGAVFITGFTVENRSGQTLDITPVGTKHRNGIKTSLPVTMAVFPHLPALRAGDFRLEHGESIMIHYDMDDVNFSEIVVEDEQGRQYQLVTDPNPTENQYHGPLQNHYIIEDLRQLAPVKQKVKEAAEGIWAAQAVSLIFLLLLVGPWIVHVIIHFLSARFNFGVEHRIIYSAGKQ